MSVSTLLSGWTPQCPVTWRSRRVAGAALALATTVLFAAGCSPEPAPLEDRVAATCETLGDWREQSPEARRRLLTGIGGLEGEALARTEFLFSAAGDALDETAELASFLAELIGQDATRLLESPACEAARRQLEAETCALAVTGSEDALARQQLAELIMTMQENCLLEPDGEDALPLPQLP